MVSLADFVFPLDLPAKLNPFKFCIGQAPAGSAGINGFLRLYQHYTALFFTDWFMLNTFGDNDHVTFVHLNDMVSEGKFEASFDGNKNLVGFRVPVPDEISFCLDQFKIAVIHLSDDFIGMKFFYQISLFPDVDLLYFHEKPFF
jgi:hypothetical protein